MFYQLATVRNRSVAELRTHCAILPRRRLADVTLADLALHPGSFGGIYIFYSAESECLYIGKTSSCGFLERIAKHFDLREIAYMNHFPKKLLKKGICPDIPAAVRYALNCEFCAFTFSENQLARDHSIKAERLFRSVLVPRLNPSVDYFD